MITRFAQWGKYVPSPVYKILAQRWIDEKWPRHLFIETTAECNLHCTFCPREQRNNEMDWEIFTKIIQEATKYGARSFSLHLFGEPLLYTRWREAVDYVKQCNSKHTILITTNGTKLNKEVDKVVSSKIDKLIWSWRPEAKFTPETKEKLRKWGKFQVRILKQVTPKHAWEEWKDWRPREVKDLHNYSGNIDLNKFKVKSRPKGRWACYHLWMAPAIRWNGDMVFCCNVPSHTVYSTLGNVNEKSIADMWKSEQLKMVRQDHLNGVYKDACKNCDSWKAYPEIFFKKQYSIQEVETLLPSLQEETS